MSLSIESVAGFSGRRPWLTILGWVLVLVGAAALSATLVPDALDGEQGPTQVLEYERAENLIDERFGSLEPEPDPEEVEGIRATQSESIIVASTSSNPGDAAFEQRIDEFSEELQHVQDEEGVQIIDGTVRDYEFQVSQDGTTALANIRIFSDREGDILTLVHVSEEFTDDEFEFFMVGNASVNATFSELAEEDLFTGESIGIAVALIILAVVFGAVISAFIPILLAIVAVFTAIGLTGIVGQVFELNEFVPNIITMMGLAVGIDYALFVLSRYNEERARGQDKQAAIETASGTAGRAVVFRRLHRRAGPTWHVDNPGAHLPGVRDRCDHCGVRCRLHQRDPAPSYHRHPWRQGEQRTGTGGFHNRSVRSAGRGTRDLWKPRAGHAASLVDGPCGPHHLDCDQKPEWREAGFRHPAQQTCGPRRHWWHMEHDHGGRDEAPIHQHDGGYGLPDRPGFLLFPA